MSPFTGPTFRTTVVTASTTTTVLTAVVVSCIPSSLFSAGSATVPCRRKRQAAQVMDLLFEDGQFQPTAVQQ